MVDLFTLALTHGLLVLALWRLLFRDDLDGEAADETGTRPWLINRKAGSSVPGSGTADD